MRGNKRYVWLVLIFIILIVQTIIYVAFSVHRNFDQDTGFYLLATKMVYEGKRPFLDFAFTQPPLHPYVYGAWLEFFGHTLFNARLLSVIFTLLLTAMMVYYVFNQTKDTRIALIASVLVAFNGFMLLWFTTVKTYAISSLFLFLSFILLTKMEKDSSNLSLTFLAGLSLGIAINTRLIFTGFILILLAYIIAIGKRTFPDIFKRVVLLVIGITISSIPSIYLFLKNPSVFIFNLIGKHRYVYFEGVARLGEGTLSTSTFLGRILQKYKSIYTALNDPQYVILAIISLISLFLLIKYIYYEKKEVYKYKNDILAFVFLIGIIVFYLMPSFLYHQYYVQTIPFLIATSTIFLTNLKLEKLRIRKFFAIVIIFFITYFLMGIPPVIFKNVASIGGKDKLWGIEQVNNVVSEIKRLTDKDDEIMAWWPGYAYLSERKLVKGLENGMFAFNTLYILGEEKAKENKILTKKETIDKVMNREPKLIVFDPTSPKEFKDLIEENYKLHKDINGVLIYIR